MPEYPTIYDARTRVLLRRAGKAVTSDWDYHHPTSMAVDNGDIVDDYFRFTLLRPREEWREEDGDVLWWRHPNEEKPYVGSPLDLTWPGYHTHWTPIPPAIVPLPTARNPEPAAAEQVLEDPPKCTDAYTLGYWAEQLEVTWDAAYAEKLVNLEDRGDFAAGARKRRNERAADAVKTLKDFLERGLDPVTRTHDDD